MGLVVFRIKHSEKFKVISAALLIVILVNFIPVKSTVTSALWTTQSTGKNMIFSKEYLSFMNQINKNISSSNNILSIPFGTASYTVVKDETSSNVYAGVSPVKIFSGVNDFSGDLSLSLTGNGEDVNKLIIEKRYSELSKILHKYNVNYLFVTNNIPNEVLHSYIYNYDSVKNQDKTFIKSLTSQRVMKSSQGNYELYAVKDRNIMISSPHTSFEKVNQVKYKIKINNLRKDQTLKFSDTFNGGWKLFPASRNDGLVCQRLTKVDGSTECKGRFQFFSSDELSYLWKKPLFQESHRSFENFSNEWTVSYDEVKGLGEGVYEQNPDGSVNINLVLYFSPQLYFYYGSLITLFVILSSTAYYIKTRRKSA
jgi:hypothetical protein